MSNHGLRPEQKAATLMLAVGSRAAANVLQYLSEEEVEALATEVTRLGTVEAEIVDSVMSEARQEASSRTGAAVGDINSARKILSEWQGRSGNDIIGRIADAPSPFSFVKSMDTEILAQLFADEHPQIAAQILSHQSPEFAASVLQRLDEDLQADISVRIATMGRTTPEVIVHFEEAVRERLGHAPSRQLEQRSGAESLASLLNNTSKEMEQAIIERLKEVDPELAEKVQALMFVFEDVAGLDDRSIQAILKDVETTDLATAMKGVGPNVSDTIFRNLSKRAGEALAEEIDLMGPVRRSEVAEAQARVVAEIRRLEEAGEIVLGRGGEDDLVE